MKRRLIWIGAALVVGLFLYAAIALLVYSRTKAGRAEIAKLDVERAREAARDGIAQQAQRDWYRDDPAFSGEVDARGPEHRRLVYSSAVMSGTVAGMLRFQGRHAGGFHDCLAFKRAGFSLVEAANSVSGQKWDLCRHWWSAQPIKPLPRPPAKH